MIPIVSASGSRADDPMFETFPSQICYYPTTARPSCLFYPENDELYLYTPFRDMIWTRALKVSESTVDGTFFQPQFSATLRRAI